MNKENNIEIYQWNKMSPSLRDKLEKAPMKEWGHLPFIKETTWSAPNWSIVLFSNNSEVLCFVNIIERNALLNKRGVKVGGINNLITAQSHRGEGYGKEVMKRAVSLLLNDLNCDYGLLLCSNDVAKFYELLGWQKFDGKLTYEQPKGKVTWGQNTYLYPEIENKKEGEIDLCGYPW